jgi:hypothetical protein
MLRRYKPSADEPGQNTSTEAVAMDDHFSVCTAAAVGKQL